MSDPILIQSESDYDAAIEGIEALLRMERTPEHETRMAALADAIEAFEDEYYPVEDVSQADMLQFLIESARATTVANVSRATGISEADLGAVLDGSATFTPEQVAEVSAYFQIDPGVFLPDEPEDGHV